MGFTYENNVVLSLREFIMDGREVGDKRSRIDSTKKIPGNYIKHILKNLESQNTF